MKPYPYMPGVPAAGHISGGYWHPGRTEGCAKCPCPECGLHLHAERCSRNPHKPTTPPRS